jgi:hypothetical protein
MCYRGAGMPTCPHRNPGPICQARWRGCDPTNGGDVAFYVDTSALVKLVVAEAESLALRDWSAADGRDLVASDLVRW